MDRDCHIRFHKFRRAFRKPLFFRSEPLAAQKIRDADVLFPHRLADTAAHAPHQIQLRKPVEDAADGNFAQREKLHRRFRREHLMVVEIGKYLPVVIVFHL